jgi:hypothetical protein
MEAITSKLRSDYGEETVYKLANDVSADETTTDAVEASNAEAITMVVEAGAGVNAGVVILEGAVSSTYAGTWVNLGQVTTSAASKAYAVSAPKSPIAENGVALPMPYVRARIETAIGVGSVDIYLIVKR